jgi:hypothetical protein
MIPMKLFECTIVTMDESISMLKVGESEEKVKEKIEHEISADHHYDDSVIAIFVNEVEVNGYEIIVRPTNDKKESV